MKLWLEKNLIEMYSTYNERKSVVAERCTRTLKNKIYKYMTSIPRNVYIDKLDDKVNECNVTYHRTIKMKPVDVKSSYYIDVNKENNKEGPIFKAGGYVRISGYTNIFAKGCVPNWSEDVFVAKKVKNTVLLTYVISDLNGEEFFWNFYEKKKNWKKHVKKSLEFKK